MMEYRLKNQTNIVYSEKYSKIQGYNLELKKQAKSHSNLDKSVENYCKGTMKENDCLWRANEQDEEAYMLYFDFYYSFMYCQTQKVILYQM